MNTLNSNRKWHAVYTKPRHEKKALERLSINGFEVFCPMTITLKQWSDRKKKISTPLIPSYIFVHVNEKEKSKVLEDPSVLNYIYWLGKPAIIRDYEIKRLKGLISKEKMQEFEIKKLKIGEKISITKGYLKDENATIKKVNNKNIYVELSELGIIVVLKKIDLII